MLCLYHGTSETAAQNILSTQLLAANGVPLTYPEDSPMGTEAGFLYLTDKLYVAIDYAIINEVDKKADRTAYVFKVSIDPDNVPLEADKQDLRQFYKKYDESEQYTFLESLQYCGSVRTPHDLKLGIEVLEYFEFDIGPLNPRNQLSKEARVKIRQFPNVSDFNPSHFKWIKV